MPGYAITFDEGALRRLQTSEHGDVARDLRRRALRVQNAARARCPVDTGRLRNSITHELGRDTRGLFVRVGTNVEYALYVEMGTRPHEIRPRNARALRWKDAGAPGGYRFATVVNHPGTRARPFLRPALAAAR
jgi:phage gpG-like protein